MKKGCIGEFCYAPIIGTDILSGILCKVSGQSVLEFAYAHLFTSLGIDVPCSITFPSKREQINFYKQQDVRGWVADNQGCHTAGWGLCITTRDMLAIGELMRQEGRYHNTQIVSKQWISQCTTKHIHWDKMNISYGYLWWLHEFGFAAMGDGGNIIYVNTKKEFGNLYECIVSSKSEGSLGFYYK